MWKLELFSIAVPGAVGALLLAFRGQVKGLAADVRGIALQTVIIMVVLLAVAGGVAAVLLSRGGEAVSDIERQDISRDASDFSAEPLCNAAGYVWSSAGGGSCNATAAIVVPPHVMATPHAAQAVCHTTTGGTDSHTHTWDAVAMTCS